MASKIQRPATAFALSGGARKRPRSEDGAHLAFIRTLPCLVTGAEGVEAAHIRFGSIIHGKASTGMSEKPSDKWTVPLSPETHRRQHSVNEAHFWRSVGVDPIVIAALLWAHTGDEEAARLVLANARQIVLWHTGR